MTDMRKAFTSAQKTAPAAGLNIEQAAYGLPEPSEPLAHFSRSELGNSLPPMPRTSMSVMVVIDENGYLTPLCTPADLLRWCKAAWRAEQG